MNRPLFALSAALATTLIGAVACSSGGGAAGPPAVTCATGQKTLAISVGYSEETSSSHTCSATPAFETGTIAAGGACTMPITCAPSCCACPAGTQKAGTQVLVSACDGMTCVAGSDVCCSDYVFGICNPAAITDAGPG